MTTNPQDAPAAPLSPAEAHAYGYVQTGARDLHDGDPLELRGAVARTLAGMLEELVARRQKDAALTGLDALRTFARHLNAGDTEPRPAATLADARDVVEHELIDWAVNAHLEDPDSIAVLDGLASALERLQRLAPPPAPGPDLELDLATEQRDELRRRADEVAAALDPIPRELLAGRLVPLRHALEELLVTAGLATRELIDDVRRHDEAVR